MAQQYAMIDLFPTTWRNDVIDYMPVNAGSQVMTVTHTSGALGAWTGLGVFMCYAVAATVAATVLVDHRDA